MPEERVRESQEPLDPQAQQNLNQEDNVSKGVDVAGAVPDSPSNEEEADSLWDLLRGLLSKMNVAQRATLVSILILFGLALLAAFNFTPKKQGDLGGLFVTIGATFLLFTKAFEGTAKALGKEDSDFVLIINALGLWLTVVAGVFAFFNI